MSTYGYELAIATGAAATTPTLMTGQITIKPGVWQMISIPARYGEYNTTTHALENLGNVAKVSSYVVDQLWDLAGQPATKAEVVEVCKAYVGDLNRNLIFVPEVTPADDEGNFPLMRTPSGDPEVVTAFWVLSAWNAPLTLDWTGWLNP